MTIKITHLLQSNKTLAQKPKLFFVNACRGGKFGKTVELVAQSTVQPRYHSHSLAQLNNRIKNVAI